MGGAVLPGRESRDADGTGERDLMAYADRVRQLVTPFGVREISREAGVSVGSVSTVKRGLGRPSMRVLRAIERAAGELGAAPVARLTQSAPRGGVKCRGITG